MIKIMLPSIRELIVDHPKSTGFSHNPEENSSTLSNQMILVADCYLRFWRLFDHCHRQEEMWRHYVETKCF